jgi:hypothetical protein
VQDRPTQDELLATVAEYLEEELIPALDGPLAYRSRVAANLVRILQREQALSGAALRREYALLRGLLGVEPNAVAPDALADAVVDLNRRVAAAIDAGAISHARVWPVLMELAHAKLAIIRPGYDAWDAVGELP